MRPYEFLDILQQEDAPKEPFQLATIPATYTTGRPSLIFDGETSATTRTYPYLGSYTPTASDRVLVAMVGTSGVILGVVT